MSAPVAEPASAATAGEESAARVFGHSFKRAIAAVRRLRGRDTHRPGELSYAQYGLLFGLAEHGQLSNTELSTVAGVAQSTATKMLDRLVEIGLVHRVRSELDRRVVLLELTPRGSELVAARRARYEQLWARTLAGFSEEQLAGATAVLDAVTGMFEEIERGHDEALAADGRPR